MKNLSSFLSLVSSWGALLWVVAVVVVVRRTAISLVEGSIKSQEDVVDVEEDDDGIDDGTSKVVIEREEERIVQNEDIGD
jgi:hypothetical protein